MHELGRWITICDSTTPRATARFVQPDTIIPSYADPQALNRYSYVNNRPVLLNDPSGHWACEDAYSCQHSDTIESKQFAEERKNDKHPKEPVVPGHHTDDEEGTGPFVGPDPTASKFDQLLGAGVRFPRLDIPALDLGIYKLTLQYQLAIIRDGGADATLYNDGVQIGPLDISIDEFVVSAPWKEIGLGVSFPQPSLGVESHTTLDIGNYRAEQTLGAQVELRLERVVALAVLAGGYEAAIFALGVAAKQGSVVPVPVP